MTRPSAPDPLSDRPVFTVSVKALCAFGAKAGDLDFRFAPVPSAQEGIAGHLLVQGRRGEGYQREVTLSTEFEGLRVRGRADGFQSDCGTVPRVEEIKTFRGDFEAIRQHHRALHWAQARTYGWMLCEKHALPAIEVALVYLDLASGEESVLAEHMTRDQLRTAFQTLCRGFTAWAQQEGRHREALRDALGRLAFPHAEFRTGQRELAQAVYRAAASRRCLIAQASTGIGKTVATIFPVLRGWPAHGTDKVFFLTAKTSGRAIALEALDRIAPQADPATTVPLRVVELRAREKLCEYPGRACSGEACPLAAGFYDRLPAARAAAVETLRLTLAALRQVALAHRVCPYYLSQEMVRWADVVVADYNYYFDGSAFLFALTRQEDWKVAVLVDEAHNLLERARGMYSAALDAGALAQARAVAPAALQPAVDRVRREWRKLQHAQTTDYAAHDEVPEDLQQALQDAVAAMAEHFAAAPEDAKGPLQRFFFEALHFVRLAASLADHSVFESTLEGMGPSDAIAVRNLIPAPHLKWRFATSTTTVCFSGTIAPFAFYRDMLGLPDDAAELEVASPFRAAQLEVRIAHDISTRYHHRAGSMRRLVDAVAEQYARRPGNYLMFFSSFDFLDKARTLFAQRHPQIAAWAQSSGMPEAERDAFVARFRAGGRGVGFAVLGGAFGEGIDLPGDRLIGVFIASLGLPQHDARNEAMRQRIDARFGGDGYAYTYLYPGLRKVIQAAGRVIRTERDAGVLHLLDDRFARPEVLRLLPPWWRIEGIERAVTAPP
ncbi:MAG: ATP-dependent DNA helicase [Janthinobacterium lividum]